MISRSKKPKTKVFAHFFFFHKNTGFCEIKDGLLPLKTNFFELQKTSFLKVFMLKNGLSRNKNDLM